MLVVRGALGEIGPGNVSVLMQLLLGMLDAALARAQDRHDADQRKTVALKIDEAPLVINESFAQTLALKRSAGLETVACWQTDAQWEPQLRERLDALFAHRVLFATASAPDARAASGLLMAEFSDQLRKGEDGAARLAAPDVRLHLPRHTAIASFTTRQGRERPFIGRTMALSLDRELIEHHARRQLERGGREYVVIPEGSDVPPANNEEELLPAPVGTPPESLAELRDLDGATRVRWLAGGTSRPRSLSLEAGELELLSWIASARCVLSSQAHRRLNPGRALSTTQRKLKRLADAGLIARFQLHREDGGGVPMCCVPTDRGFELLELSGRRAPVLTDPALPGLRDDLHTVGWLLALETALGGELTSVLGPGRARLAPPNDCSEKLMGLAAGEYGRGFAANAFAVLRPAAAVALASAPGELLVVRAGVDVELELLAGWWRVSDRYRPRGGPPRVVVLCGDDEAARKLALEASDYLVAHVASIGAHPGAEAYGGRTHIWFAGEEGVHFGQLVGWQTGPVGAGAPQRSAFAAARQDEGASPARWI